MKHKSIFTIFAALTMVLGFAMTGLGQITANLTANAYVLGALSITNSANLQFGNVAYPGSKTISTAGVATGLGNAGGIISAGIFKVDKTTGTMVSVTFTVIPTPLVGLISPHTLPISYLAIWNNDLNSGSGTTVDVTPNELTETNSTDATIYVHLGGTVTPQSNVTFPDTYSGTVTLSAVYN